MAVINSPDYYFHIRGEVSDASWLENKKLLAFNVKSNDDLEYKVQLKIE